MSDEKNKLAMLDDDLKSHILNLYMMALSDGSFASEELDVILEIAEDKGFSREEFEKLILTPNNRKFHFPEDFMERIYLLYDLTRVILADDVIEEDEVSTFMRFCKRFEFSLKESEELFEWLIDLAKRKVTTQVLEEEINKLIK